MPVEYSPTSITGVNGSGESIPPRSFVKSGASGSNVTITRGADTSTFRAVTAEKPNGSDGDAYFVTGPVATADGSQLLLYSPVTPVWVKFDSVPTGNACGPVSGQWTASSSGTGFRLLHYESSSGMGLIVANVGDSAGPGAGGGTGGGGVCACDVSVPGVVAVDCLAQPLAYRWEVTLPAPIGNVTVTYDQESGYWVSDPIEVECETPIDDPYDYYPDNNTYVVKLKCAE